MENFPKISASKDRFPRRPEQIAKEWRHAKDTGRLLFSSLYAEEYWAGQRIHEKNKKEYSSTIEPLGVEDDNADYKEWLELYAKNKEDEARLQAFLLDKMRNDPNFWLDPKKVLNSQDFELLNNTDNSTNISNVLDKCQYIHQTVEDLCLKFPDPADLYEYVFAHKPVGNIEIIKGPVSIYFKCFHLDDYAWIWRGSFFNQESQPLTDEDRESANRSGGCAISGAARPELNNIVIAEKAGKNPEHLSLSIQKHEEEHIIREILKQSWGSEKFSSYKRDPALTEKIRESQRLNLKNNDSKILFLDGVSLDLAEEHIVDIIRDYRPYNYARGADEIFAFFKDGEHTAWDTFYYLTKPQSQGGLYDYFEDDINSLKSNISSDPKVHAIIEKILTKERDRYNDMLWYAVQSLRELYGTGKYSRDEIIALLDKEPLSKWPKVSERLIKGGI